MDYCGQNARKTWLFEAFDLVTPQNYLYHKIKVRTPRLILSVKLFMDIQLINIGFGNIVSANRVVAIVSPESAPIKRIITDARDRGQLIDATYGRRTRAVIVTDSSHIILSAIQPETVAHRFVISKNGATRET